MKFLTFSRHFPSYHPRKGQPTFFVEKIWISQWPNDSGRKLLHPDLSIEQSNYTSMDFSSKWHTIRPGHRWKAGDWFKPVVWGNDINPKSGRSGPYHSKHVQFQDPIQVKKTWDFKVIIDEGIKGDIELDGNCISTHDDLNIELLTRIAQNDGLFLDDFLAWFKYPKPFDGQIICWNDKIEY